jgi:SAM-dependent methyltransferase
MNELLNLVYQLGGDQRRDSMRKAAELILDRKPRRMIETGCYRGAGCDGNSTWIFALLKQALGSNTRFESYDLNQPHIDKARALLAEHNLQDQAVFVTGDSITNLGKSSLDEIGFAYLDSYDFEAHNPGPSQRHQLAEFGAIAGRLGPESIVLLDDWGCPHGGKGGLLVPFLKETGWKVVLEGYQILFTR